MAGLYKFYNFTWCKDAHLSIFRSSLPEVLYKKCVLRNFAKLTGKYLCRSLFFNKVADLQPAALLKRNSGTCVFMCILRNFKNSYFLKHLPTAIFWFSFKTNFKFGDPSKATFCSYLASKTLVGMGLKNF